jgi:hypothetical protein
VSKVGPVAEEKIYKRAKQFYESLAAK